jgi:hypothetical protein
MSDPAARAVVSDDGSTIWLTAYTATGDAVPVVLMPARAVALAGELIAAAVPKLNVTAKSTKRRGGDPQAQQRRQRDEAICALATLSGKGKPIEQQARDIAQRLDRYRPMPVETIPERRLMQEIKNSGLPIGRRRISKILREPPGVLIAQPSLQD